MKKPYLEDTESSPCKASNMAESETSSCGSLEDGVVAITTASIATIGY